MKTYSQIFQDVFTLNLFENRKGIFLDLGCGDGMYHPCGNNTLLLEQFGWEGLSIDVDHNAINSFKNNRKTLAVCCDLLKTNITEILSENKFPKIIDYLSFDIDEATDQVLNNFPFNEYTFNFITFEHNLYHPGYKGLKEKSKELFLSNGYEILIENVKLDCGPVEDWFINPKYSFSKKIYLKDLPVMEVLKRYNIC